MSATKHRMAFEQLEAEMTVLRENELIDINDSTFLGVTNASSSGYGGSGYGGSGYGDSGYGDTGYGGQEYVRTAAEGTPTITIGPLTPTGISQSVDFSNFGTSFVPGYGGFAAFVTTTGSIGYSQNSNGQWEASASFAIRPPSGFSQENVTGNVNILVNGSVVGSFELNDERDDPNNTIVYETGTVPVSGTFTMPSDFNGAGVVTFEIHTGAVQNNGNYNYYSNSSHTVGLVLQGPS